MITRARLANLGLLAGSVALGVALVEIALRLAGSGTTASYVLAPRNATMRDKQTDWDIVYRTNALGLRDDEIPRRKPEGEFRVAMIGDSFIFGQGCERGEIAADRLEAILRGEGIHAEVVNASNVGLNPRAYLAILRDVVLDLHPDLIVVSVYGNDASDATEPPRWRRFASSLAEHSRVVTLVRKVIRIWKLKHDPVANGEALAARPLPDDPGGLRARALDAFQHAHGATPNNLIAALALDPGGIERSLAPEPGGPGRRSFQRDVGEVVDLCRDAGIPLVLAIVPDAAQVDAGHVALLRSFGLMIADDTLTAPSGFESFVTEFARARNVACFDPTEAFRAAEGRLYFESDLHWNPAGQALFAEHLAAFLREKALLPR
jgi:lysophospholipase L1-like esterase